MITVFTPAYNRAGTLPRLYKSLLAQTCTEFEWLIIDDGSVDDTSEVVKGFTGEGKFPVRYLYKKNGGKHTAHNLALSEAAGTFFWCVDSDDLLAPTAVDAVYTALRNRGDAIGVCSYKSDLDGNLLGGPFPSGVTPSGLLELNQRYHCTGEFALTFVTDFARKYPFPVFEGERFVTESVVYDRMQADGGLILLPQVTNICEYQPEGYSNNINQVMKNNPAGYCLYFLQRIDLMNAFKARMIQIGKYWCFRWISRNRDLKYSGPHNFAVLLGIPVGAFFWAYYKLVRGL